MVKNEIIVGAWKILRNPPAVLTIITIYLFIPAFIYLFIYLFIYVLVLSL